MFFAEDHMRILRRVAYWIFLIPIIPFFVILGAVTGMLDEPKFTRWASDLVDELDAIGLWIRGL